MADVKTDVNASDLEGKAQATVAAEVKLAHNFPNLDALSGP